jgi:ataxia telangiectasia mutated family protein
MKSLQEGSIDKRGKKMEAKFIEMRKQFHPVFRHFFREQQKQPMAWFLMRLNYARSLAVTSIAGHLLGLGDRHCSNILIDRISGELVHIDLGIAFDQGRLLHIPERVPFRLTNDMIDGLGMSGTEGTFKRCSEHTLRVLRAASDVLMTVLECLKYDPLQDW